MPAVKKPLPPWRVKPISLKEEVDVCETKAPLEANAACVNLLLVIDKSKELEQLSTSTSSNQDDDLPSTRSVSSGDISSDAPSLQQDLGDAEMTKGIIGKIPDEYLCVKHWEPSEDIEQGLTLVHGDRIQVIWTDDCKEGWAYGYHVRDATQQGYFPQQSLAVPKRHPLNFVVGQVYKVSDHFEAPAWQGGYLNVAPGDVIIVLHQDPGNKCWMYARKEGDFDEAGWLPEACIAGRPVDP